VTIRNFSDHAANERTFLAWVRTAVGLIGFGFVVERFDLVLRALPTAAGAPHTVHRGIGEAAGLGLMVAGLVIVAFAYVRFAKATREIDDETQHLGPGARFDLALTLLLVVMGSALVGYMLLNVLDIS
jgi:putative membrane protein